MTKLKMLKWVVSALFISMVAAYLLQFKPPSRADRNFLVKIESAFINKNEIFLRDVTSFLWDRVCFSRSDSMGHDVSDAVSIDPDIRKKISKKYVVLAFFNQEKLVHIAGYNGAQKITINGNKYRFLTSFTGKGCGGKNAALLVSKGPNEKTDLNIIFKGE